MYTGKVLENVNYIVTHYTLYEYLLLLFIYCVIVCTAAITVFYKER